MLALQTHATMSIQPFPGCVDQGLLLTCALKALYWPSHPSSPSKLFPDVTAHSWVADTVIHDRA